MRNNYIFMRATWFYVAIMFFLMGAVNSYAAEKFDPIPFTVGYDNPVPYTVGHGKDAPVVPTVVQHGYEISIQSPHPAYTLFIIMEGTVVWSVAVPSTITSVILPSWLVGEYNIELHPNDSNYYFYGYIELIP